MLELNINSMDRMMYAIAEFVGCVSAIVSDTHEQAEKLIDSFASPERFIEYENDGNGLRAFYLATAKRCVELLERN